MQRVHVFGACKCICVIPRFTCQLIFGPLVP